MVIGLFGESCVGKSTIAGELAKTLSAQVFTGRDYLRMAKNEDEAKALFRQKLEKESESVIYIISDKEQLSLLPENALRVLITAELDVIKARFAKRTGGQLSPPLAHMLERNHGMFDSCERDLLVSGEDTQSACAAILEKLQRT